MLDINLIMDTPEIIKENLRRRNFNKIDLIDLIQSKYSEFRKLTTEVSALKNEKNLVSKQVGILKAKGKDASELIQKIKELPEQIKKYDEQIKNLKSETDSFILEIPNMISDNVPEGINENDNIETRKFGLKPEFAFEPLAHWDIGKNLDILDFETAAKITGSRFVVLKKQAAALERALINFMIETHIENGYEELMPPFIVNSDSLTGTGQLPKFGEDLFKLEGFNYYLVPTAEVPVTNIFRNDILEKNMLPKNFCAFTPCFRAEAGSWGKDTRGIIRQHQFNKVELVKFTEPENSETEHEKLLNHAEIILQKLGLHYRVVILCAGDTGFSSSKTYDIEVWMPSQNKYREISSCSNFRDFQARRMNIKYRPMPGAKPEFVHTLNGSGLAVGRTLAAVIENFQNADGTITIPEVLRKYTGFDVIK